MKVEKTQRDLKVSRFLIFAQYFKKQAKD